MAYEQKDPLGRLLSCREALEQERVESAVSTAFSTGAPVQPWPSQADAKCRKM